MGAPLAVNDVVQITYHGTLESQTILSVLHARVSAPGSGATDVEQLDKTAIQCADVNFPFLKAYMAAATNEFFMDWVQVQRVKPTRTIYARQTIQNFGGQLVGAGPPNIAVSIEKRSLKPNRQGVGRLQYAPVPNGLLGASVDGDYQIAFLQPLADTLSGAFFVTQAGLLSYQWCLPSGGADPEYDVWDAFVHSSTRTMHRRTLGLGV